MDRNGPLGARITADLAQGSLNEKIYSPNLPKSRDLGSAPRFDTHMLPSYHSDQKYISLEFLATPMFSLDF